MFVNWKSNNLKTLEAYFRNFQDNHGIEIVIQNISLNEFIKVVFKKPHPYDIVVIALDATRPNLQPFYKHFFGEKQNLLDVDTSKIFPIFEKISQNGSIDQINNLNRLIAAHQFILPLYQEVRDFYYPKHIKNLNTGKDFLEYPEIGELQL